MNNDDNIIKLLAICLVIGLIILVFALYPRDKGCSSDLECLAQDYLPAVSEQCPGMIEKLSQYEFTWTFSGQNPRFQQYEWHNEPNKEIIYIGDRFKQFNPQEIWQNYIYRCTFNTQENKVIDVKMYAGVL